MPSRLPQPAPLYARRQAALRSYFSQLKIEALLVVNLPDVRYLCGFTGSNAALVVGPARSVLFTDGRYTVQARQETQAARVSIISGSAQSAVTAWLAQQGIARCGIDEATITLATYSSLQKTPRAMKVKLKWQPVASPVPVLRQRKDAYELACMKEAAALGCELYFEALANMAAGATEISIAAKLEHAARSRGAEKMSFDTIVASGPRSSLPHGQATQARLPRRGFVTLDFGVILKGYCSDMTRTVHIGKALPQEHRVFEAVLAAQESAVAAVRPGVTCGEVDEAARSVLRAAKLDRYFSHSTGHGVGLEIHESPRIAAGVKTTLEPGMVITIEPGAYLPGKFGIRIEDMVAVTESGHQVLTPAPKGWTALA